MKLNSKKTVLIIALVIIGLVLIILGNKSEKSDADNQVIDYKSYTKELENKLESFLVSIDGIKKAKVIITLDNSSEQGNAQNQTTYDYLTNGSSKSEGSIAYPSVKGVAIACTNGNNDEMKIKITKLITAYLGISSNRIEIVGIK